MYALITILAVAYFAKVPLFLYEHLLILLGQPFVIAILFLRNITKLDSVVINIEKHYIYFLFNRCKQLTIQLQERAL